MFLGSEEYDREDAGFKKDQAIKSIHYVSIINCFPAQRLETYQKKLQYRHHYEYFINTLTPHICIISLSA